MNIAIALVLVAAIVSLILIAEEAMAAHDEAFKIGGH